MKRVLITTLLLAIPFMALAQIKVLESNPKKAPAWITAAVSDYFVASAIAGSLEEAKALSLEDVKKQIISAVAENIKSSTSQTTSQQSTQNEIVDFLETFDSNFETRSAIVPFVNGVSMSKVKGFYYEKTLNKATGITSYSYTILYPFSEAELNTLIKKFMALDAEMEATLNSQIAKIGNIKTTEEIDRAISALEPLLDYFFDDVRIAKTKNAITQLKKIYSYITLELVSSSPGEMVYALMVEGNPITTSVKPTFRSNCAMALMYNDMGDGMVKVTYDSEGCMDEEQNFIEVSYRIPYSPIKKQLFPTMTSSPLRILTSGTMHIALIETPEEEEEALEEQAVEVVEEVVAEEVQTEEVEEDTEDMEEDQEPKIYDGLEIEFQLNNRSTTTGKLTSITLQVAEISTTINLGGLSIDVIPGVSAITIPYEKSVKFMESKFNLSFTKGSVSIMNPKNGQVQTVPVIIKYTIE